MQFDASCRHGAQARGGRADEGVRFSEIERRCLCDGHGAVRQDCWSSSRLLRRSSAGAVRVGTGPRTGPRRPTSLRWNPARARSLSSPSRKAGRCTVAYAGERLPEQENDFRGVLYKSVVDPEDPETQWQITSGRTDPEEWADNAALADGVTRIDVNGHEGFLGVYPWDNDLTRTTVAWLERPDRWGPGRSPLEHRARCPSAGLGRPRALCRGVHHVPRAVSRRRRLIRGVPDAGTGPRHLPQICAPARTRRRLRRHRSRGSRTRSQNR